MGTARINALGLPPSLVQLKKAKGLLEWGHLKTAIATSYKQTSQSIAQSTIPINYGLW